MERELGRGGMGVVYLAREVRLDRSLAIKMLPPSMTADPRLCERFLRAGWQNVYVPSAQVTHEGGHATEDETMSRLGIEALTVPSAS